MTRYQDIAQLLDANAITNVVDAYENAYEKGRADAIKEVCEFMIEYGIIDCHFCPCDTCDDDCWVTLEKTIEQLKEQNK